MFKNFFLCRVFFQYYFVVSLILSIVLFFYIKLGIPVCFCADEETPSTVEIESIEQLQRDIYRRLQEQIIREGRWFDLEGKMTEAGWAACFEIAIAITFASIGLYYLYKWWRNRDPEIW